MKAVPRKMHLVYRVFLVLSLTAGVAVGGCRAVVSLGYLIHKIFVHGWSWAKSNIGHLFVLVHSHHLLKFVLFHLFIV
jgi:hypothetical protein